MKKKEIDLVKFFEKQNEYLHRVYGDWVSIMKTPDGFAMKVTLKGVDIEATLEKMDNDPNAPTNGKPIVDILLKLRYSLETGTFVPKAVAKE